MRTCAISTCASLDWVIRFRVPSVPKPRGDTQCVSLPVSRPAQHSRVASFPGSSHRLSISVSPRPSITLSVISRSEAKYLLSGLGQEPTPEANGYGVGSRPCLQLRQQVAHMALDRLLGEVEPVADLAVHETLRDELENLDLAGRRRMLGLRDRSDAPGTRSARQRAYGGRRPSGNGANARDSGSRSLPSVLRPRCPVSAALPEFRFSAHPSIESAELRAESGHDGPRRAQLGRLGLLDDAQPIARRSRGGSARVRARTRCDRRARRPRRSPDRRPAPRPSPAARPAASCCHESRGTSDARQPVGDDARGPSSRSRAPSGRPIHTVSPGSGAPPSSGVAARRWRQLAVSARRAASARPTRDTRRRSRRAAQPCAALL